MKFSAMTMMHKALDYEIITETVYKPLLKKNQLKRIYGEHQTENESTYQGTGLLIEFKRTGEPFVHEGNTYNYEYWLIKFLVSTKFPEGFRTWRKIRVPFHGEDLEQVNLEDDLFY